MRKRKGYSANPFAPGNPYVPDNLCIPERERESYVSLRAPRGKDDRPGEGEWIIRGRKLLIWKRPPPDPRLTHWIYSDEGMSSMAVASGPSLTASTPCAGWLRPSVGALIRGRKRPSS
jgi:hypothetical protein